MECPLWVEPSRTDQMIRTAASRSSLLQSCLPAVGQHQPCRNAPVAGVQTTGTLSRKRSFVGAAGDGWVGGKRTARSWRTN
jgi:hypothetical protein